MPVQTYACISYIVCTNRSLGAYDVLQAYFLKNLRHQHGDEQWTSSLYLVGISVQYIKRDAVVSQIALERRAREQIRSPGPFQQSRDIHSRREMMGDGRLTLMQR